MNTLREGSAPAAEYHDATSDTVSRHETTGTAGGGHAERPSALPSIHAAGTFTTMTEEDDMDTPITFDQRAKRMRRRADFYNDPTRQIYWPTVALFGVGLAVCGACAFAFWMGWL